MAELFVASLGLPGRPSRGHNAGALEHASGPVLLDIQCHIKRALDKPNVLNPRKLFPHQQDKTTTQKYEFETIGV